MKNRKLAWNNATSAGKEFGDLSQALTSDWVSVNGRPFSISLMNTAAASPALTWVFETSNDGGTTADAIDPSLLTPSPTNPDGTTNAQHQTLHFPGITAGMVRVRSTGVSGGAADTAKGRVVVG